MKNIIRVTSSILILIFISINIYAENPPIVKKRVSKAAIEENLFVGLKSKNLGLKISSAYMLGEIKSKNAVKDLTDFIKNVDNDKARLTAVLALLKIAASESMVKLNQEEENDQISQLCERLMSCHSCLTDISNPQSREEEVSVVSE